MEFEYFIQAKVELIKLELILDLKTTSANFKNTCHSVKLKARCISRLYGISKNVYAWKEPIRDTFKREKFPNENEGATLEVRNSATSSILMP